MSKTYIVKSNDETLETIAKAQKITIEKLLKLNPKLNKDGKLKIGDTIKLDWIKYQLKHPKVIAIATDSYLRPTTPFPDHTNLPGVAPQNMVRTLPKAQVVPRRKR